MRIARKSAASSCQARAASPLVRRCGAGSGVDVRRTPLTSNPDLAIRQYARWIGGSARPPSRLEVRRVRRTPSTPDPARHRRSLGKERHHHHASMHSNGRAGTCVSSSTSSTTKAATSQAQASRRKEGFIFQLHKSGGDKTTFGDVFCCRKSPTPGDPRYLRPPKFDVAKTLGIYLF